MSNPAALPFLDQLSVTATVSNDTSFALQPVPIASGQGQTTVTGWRAPVLMFFAGGAPDQSFRLSYTASTGSQQALAEEENNSRPTRPKLRRDRRIFSHADRHHSPESVAGGRASAPLLNPGTVQAFWLDVDRPAPNRYERHQFTLTVATPHAYIWVDDEDRDRVDRRALAELGRYWESIAYPRAIATFGDVPRGRDDIDGDEHVYILITSTTGNSSAYFNSVDMLPETQDEKRHSNHHKLVVIGQKYVDPRRPDVPTLLATAIHEFQHLINFSQKGYLPFRHGQPPLGEDAWLDEGLSVYAEQVGGFGLPSHDAGTVADVAHFLEETPDVPIVTSGDSDDVDYAAAYLFATYLADRFGPEAVRKLVAVPATGLKGVEAATGQPFASVFADWGVSLYASGLSADPRFSYRSFDLRKRYGGHQFQGVVPPLIASHYPLRRKNSGRNWSLQFVAFAGQASGGTLKVGITAGTGVQPVALVLGRNRS